MPPLRPFEEIGAGGVDSRSNPLNMPRNRALRCLNWCPKQADYWELRWGYSAVDMSAIDFTTPIHSIFSYRTWDGNKYVIFMQDVHWKVLNLSTGEVTEPSVAGTIASASKGAGYFCNNRFHYGNGTEQQWFDGLKWRRNGIASLAMPLTTVTEGVRELTPTEAAAVTLTGASGGSFHAETTGRLYYVALFDVTQTVGSPSTNEVGPATISVGSGRLKLALNQKATLGSLPNLSSVNANWVKLIAGTKDAGAGAYFFTNTSTAVASCTREFTHQASIVSTGHGLTTGDVVILAGTGFDGVYAVTVVDVDTFTIILPFTNTGPDSTGGTVKRIITAGNSATSIDVTADSQDESYQVNQSRGLAASTIGGPTPGYQFAVSLYAPNAGEHVSNCVNIGQRALQTGYRCNWHLNNLTALAGLSVDYRVLVGRTGDGAQSAKPLTDAAGNWVFTGDPNQTSLLISAGDLDPNRYMPTRNGVIPAECTMFALTDSYVYAADPNSPYLRRSGSLADALAGVFTGRPEQSWAANDIITFPTGEALTGIFEVDQEILCGTLHDCAISVNLAGIEQWVGPWNVGIAGKRAGAKCGAWGFFWITGDKQLATLQQGVPLPVSDEYELAELSQIGDDYLPEVELVYYRNAAKGKDEIRIEARKQDGTPYTIIHDFKLRDGTAPNSPYGQGYAAQFAGPLAQAFTSAVVRDFGGRLQIYAGGSDGRLYQLYDGASDAGATYDADAILLLNGGPDRPDVPWIDFYGDQNIKITVGRNLQTSLEVGAAYTFDPPSADADEPQSVPGAEQDFLYRITLIPPEVQRLYLRLQLTSHPDDGDLELNSPPHVPLESYGRLYEFVPTVGDTRDR